MSVRIQVIGMGAEGPSSLRPELRERIQTADFLAGGERHLNHFPTAKAQRFVIKSNLDALVAELQVRMPQQSCVVLASGDPLFFGIGTFLAECLGPGKLDFAPTLSSMQLAFARAEMPWESAALASVHGRPLHPTLLPLLGRPLIGLFTQDGAAPASIAEFFLRHGADDYQGLVAENLGTPREGVTAWLTLEELRKRPFAPLNYLILRRTLVAVEQAKRQRLRALTPGVPDDAFERPDDAREIMTRQEVRSVVLAKLCRALQPGDVCWDIGAGLGTVSVELAVLRPQVEVLAVERDPARLTFLRRNRERFDALNIRIIESTAPHALQAETERPRLVFIGGSGEHLSAILNLVAQRLHDGGRLVANFVTLENLMLALQRLRDLSWPVEVTEVHVARSDALAGLTGLKPQRGVFIVSADKPEAARA
ncbi:MAG: precorrin-6y C5,15-methyltransferase (decarboxylating) subunit CbiE [Gemmataceae bacterium]|nr:precorrin-6y C5,15-methyltransferase (decarboxylating) subunit CbiE [Gemmataceae bacterium]